MDSRWIEITAKGPRKARTEIIDLLIEAGSPGVLECDDNEPKGKQGGFALRPYPPKPAKKKKKRLNLTVKAYLPNKARRRLDPLKEELARLKWSFVPGIYKEEDWATKWRDSTHPVTVTEGASGIKVIIKASWHEIHARPEDIIIDIDPGMAFGTGSHPSTRMSVQAIVALTRSEDGNGGYGPIKSLLDVGSGTGILSITAKKLGVRHVLGLDIEAGSPEIARKNARRNKVTCSFKYTLVEALPGTFDIVVANILSKELIRLAPLLAGKVKPYGYVILSGILSEEAAEVKYAYMKHGFSQYLRYAQSATYQGGGSWVTFVFKKTD